MMSPHSTVEQPKAKAALFLEETTALSTWPTPLLGNIRNRTFSLIILIKCETTMDLGLSKKWVDFLSM